MTGMALATSALMLTACGNKNNKETPQSMSEMPEVSGTVSYEKNYVDYVGPKDTLEFGETKLPDGLIKVVEPINKANNKDIKITTTNPDGTKTERNDYSENGLQKYIEITRWPNGSTKERKRYWSYVSEERYPEAVVNSEGKKYNIVCVQNRDADIYYERRNKKGTLLIWYDNFAYEDLNKLPVKYDEQGRIISILNKEIFYEGDSPIPKKTVQKNEDCERITIYTSDGMDIKQDYFKASDGTITQASELEKIQWE